MYNIGSEIRNNGVAHATRGSSNGKPYQLAHVTPYTANFPSGEQVATYTSYGQINTITDGAYGATFKYNSDMKRVKMASTQNGSVTKTKYYFGSSYEKEVSGTTTTEYIWIGGDAYTAVAVAKIVNNGTPQVWSIFRDHLGSITHVKNGTTVQEYSYDAWGRRRDKDTWSYSVDDGYTLFADRGFTGHEHLTEFGLINMNGRLYDPLVGRFLSPDNYVQDASNTQNFNRYGYCLNNPLRYTDPDGEFFVIDSWIIGLFSGGWKEANKRAGNDIKIWGGLFASDPNKSFGGRVWETISRFTWQLPQTIGGFLTSHSYNTLGLSGGVESVDYKYGATVVKTRDSGWGGITQGSFIVGDNSIAANANNRLFQHEYGHYIQSQKVGWLYYSKYGLPSATSKKWAPHSLHPSEQDANILAFMYFSKNIDDFNFVDKYGNQSTHWNKSRNPINGYNWFLSLDSPQNIQALESGRLKPTWYDYLLSPFNIAICGILVPGLVNSIIQNNQY
jgi:RHS repeat-associated protein